MSVVFFFRSLRWGSGTAAQKPCNAIRGNQHWRWRLERDTYVQEWVIGLSEAATGIHDLVHVLHDDFLANSVFKNDCVACRTA